MATARLEQLVNGALRESHDSSLNGSTLARGSSGIAATLANRSTRNADAARQSRGAVEGTMLLNLVKGNFSTRDTSASGPPVSAAKVWELEAGLASGSTAVLPSTGEHRERRAEKTFSEDEQEWRSLFDKKIKVSSEWLRVSLSGYELEDAQVFLLADLLDERLQGRKVSDDESQTLWCDLALDQNQFGDEGLAAVLDVLEAHRVSCRMIKLYKNNLTDAGGIRLAEMIWRQMYPAEEIHLSHNGFTARTLIGICMAMELNESYPLIGEKQKHSPCWVRIERNSITSPLEVLGMLEREANIRTCSAKNRTSCGPGRCELSGKKRQSTPPVHLYMLQKQSGLAPGQAAVVDEARRAELRSEIQRWRARAICKDAPSFSSGGTKGSTASRKILEVPSNATSEQEKQPQLGKDELLKWFSVVDPSEDGFPEDVQVCARDVQELGLSSAVEPMEQEDNSLSRLLATATQNASWKRDQEEANASWKRDQEEARRRQVETALEIVTACLPPDDTEVFSRWKRHIEETAEPEVEANRILRMMTKLHGLGYLGPAAPVKQTGSRSSSPFAYPNMPSDPRSRMFSPSGMQSETVGSLARRAAAGGFSHFANGHFSTAPHLTSVASPPSGPSSPAPHQDGVTALSSSREARDQELLGLLTKLQQSTSPGHSTGPRLATAFDEAAKTARDESGECRPDGEMEKKKKGKNKINANVSRAETGDPVTDGLPSALARKDLIPVTTLSHSSEGGRESSWLDVQPVESTDLLQRLVGEGPKSGTEEKS